MSSSAMLRRPVRFWQDAEKSASGVLDIREA